MTDPQSRVARGLLTDLGGTPFESPKCKHGPTLDPRRMIKDLLDRPIEKLPTTLTFDGRILYLLDDAELMKAQLYEYPVERNAVRDGGFACSVAGKRRGKGSSREARPYAELHAGIKVVVAARERAAVLQGRDLR